MEKEELKHLAKLLRAFRDDSVDQDEYEKRDDLLFDVRFEFEAYVAKYRHWQGSGETERTKCEVCSTKDDEFEKLQDKMQRIKTWCDAYPVKIFHEPSLADFKTAHKVLKQHGLTLDAISASNMRHVLSGISNIIEDKC